MKNILLQIFATKIGWLIICLLGAATFIVLSDRIEWADTAIFICIAYPVILTLTAIVYAFIINPIKEYKQNKKSKDGK